MKVKIINKSTNPLPKYETIGSAAMDVRSDLKNTILNEDDENYRIDDDGQRKSIVLFNGGRVLIQTGLSFKIPEGYELQIRSRSGLSFKNGIIVLNAPGTLDSDYTGLLGLIIMNTDFTNCFVINHGDRLAQILLKKVEKIEFEEVEELPITERADGGYGHTGIK